MTYLQETRVPGVLTISTANATTRWQAERKQADFSVQNNMKFCAGSKILPGLCEYRHVWLTCMEPHTALTAQAAQFEAGSGLGAYVTVTLLIAI